MAKQARRDFGKSRKDFGIYENGESKGGGRQMTKSDDAQETSVRRDEEYIIEVEKAVFPTLFGIIAGVLSFLFTDPAEGDGLLLVTIFIVMQRFLYPRFNLLKDAKDFMYMFFMTLLSWIITFTLLLNLFNI